MKVYIAGAIAKDPDYREKFNRAADIVESLGHVALNPAILPDGLDQADYMRICFAMLDSADFILPLYDAKQSEGAKVELAYCERIRKFTIDMAMLCAVT